MAGPTFRDDGKISNNNLKRAANIEPGARAAVYVQARKTAYWFLGSLLRAALLHMRQRRGERIQADKDHPDVQYALLRHNLTAVAPKAAPCTGPGAEHCTSISQTKVKRVIRKLLAEAVVNEAHDAQRFQLPVGRTSTKTPTVSQEALDLLHVAYERVLRHVVEWAQLIRTHSRRTLTTEADAKLADVIVMARFSGMLPPQDIDHLEVPRTTALPPPAGKGKASPAAKTS